MYHYGFRAVLLFAASALVTQIGCVSPATVAEEPKIEAEAEARPAPAEQQVTALRAEVDNLVDAVAALETDVAIAQAEAEAAQAEAAAAQAAAEAAQAEAAAAQAGLDEADAAAKSAADLAGLARAEAEQTRAEVEQTRAEAEQTRAEVEQTRAEVEQTRAEVEQTRAEVEQTRAEVDALAAAAQSREMVAAASQPEAVPFAADRIDLSRLHLDAAQASLAGPDSIYVSSISYDGQQYSALLKYHGGTRATVERIFGVDGTRIPALVDLSRTRLAVVESNLLDISYVELDGQGYSGQLRFAGENRLEVVGIQRVTLPPTALEQISAAEAAAAAARADAAAAVSAAQAEATAAQTAAATAQAEATTAQAAAVSAQAEATTAQAAAATAQAEATTAQAAEATAQAEATTAQAAEASAQAEAASAQAEAASAQAEAASAQAAAASAQAQVAALQLELDPQSQLVPLADLDMRLLSLDSARVSIAGPRSLYISGIRYHDREFAARLRYTESNAGVAEALFDTADGEILDLDLSAPEVAAVARDTLIISNVGIGGTAFVLSFRVGPDGAIAVTQRGQGHSVRSPAELLRRELLRSPDVVRVASGFAGGVALPDEGTWTTSGAGVRQIDVDATHAKLVFNVAQPEAETLYGLTARAHGGKKLGYGLHFLASGTPRSGNTWNYGRSYLVWVTQEVDFYDNDEAHVQLYQSLEGNRLMWLNSARLAGSLASNLTLEALYQPDDCPPAVATGACHGSITVLVDGTEQFKVAVSPAAAGPVPDTIALRSLHGPVEFLDLYVYARR